MPIRYYDRRERREPEKTPLIDVIFLLLIFFFVTVVGLDVSRKPTFGPTSGGSQKKLDLLPMSNPLEPAPDSLENTILLQVQPAASFQQAMITEMNALIDEINHLKKQPFGYHAPIQSESILVFMLDSEFSDMNALARLVSELRDNLDKFRLHKTLTVQTRLSQLVNYFPINLPPKNEEEFHEDAYKEAIKLLRARINSHFEQPNQKELHIRMHRSVYVKFIDDLFEIANQDNINLKNIKFRVIDQKNI